MSLSKIQTFDCNPRRDSYYDRVCDDLSEALLNYLPLKDKFRFECVSKQFQRTVYKRHYSLIICEVLKSNPKTFEAILKKLPNVKSVKCMQSNNDGFLNQIYIPFNDSAFDLVIKNCNNLDRFDVNLSNISDSMKESFSQKFGSKLVAFLLNSNDIKLINDSFVDIQEIECKYDFFGDVFDHISSLKLKELRKLAFILNDKDMVNKSNEEISQSLRRLFQRHKNITHLSVYLSNNNFVDLLFKEMSQLDQLIGLKLICNGFMFNNISINSLTNGLKEFSVKCPKLRSLDVIYFRATEESHLIEFMNGLKRFKELKRLDIDIEVDSQIIENCFNNSLKYGFENLTHLRIKFNVGFMYPFILKEIIITDIDKYLPELQILSIKNPIEATELTADIMSRLSNLETLELNITDNSLSNFFKNKIQEKCRKVKSIKLSFNGFSFE